MSFANVHCISLQCHCAGLCFGSVNVLGQWMPCFKKKLCKIPNYFKCTCLQWPCSYKNCVLIKVIGKNFWQPKVYAIESQKINKKITWLLGVFFFHSFWAYLIISVPHEQWGKQGQHTPDTNFRGWSFLNPAICGCKEPLNPCPEGEPKLCWLFFTCKLICLKLLRLFAGPIVWD